MPIIKPTIRTEIYNKILVMIDSYTEDGVPVATEDNIDVEKKVIELTDMAQKEEWRRNKITSQHVITRKPPENRLEAYEPNKIIDFEGTTQYVPNEEGLDNVQGYAIKVDGDCTLTYQENQSGVWVDILSIAPTGINTITEYKGTLPVVSTSNKVRLKIEGTTHFIHKDRALWKLLYASSKVPSGGYWILEELPDDFNGVDMIVEEFGNGVYSQLPNYKYENYRDFYVAFGFEGTIRITYHPIPPTVTSLDDELQLDVNYAQMIVYDVAAKLGFYENPDIVNWAEGRRLEMKNDNESDEAPSADIITDYYG